MDEREPDILLLDLAGCGRCSRDRVRYYAVLLDPSIHSVVVVLNGFWRSKLNRTRIGAFHGRDHDDREQGKFKKRVTGM